MPDFGELDGFLAGYDLGTVRSRQSLGGGMFLKPLLLATDSGRYVLRAHTFRATEAAFRFQAETLDGIALRGVLCPRVVRDRTGRLGLARGGVFWAVHEYLDGRCFDWRRWCRAKRDPGFLRGIGFQVGRVHSALAQSRPEDDDHLSSTLPPVQFGQIDTIHAQWREDMRRVEGGSAHHAPRSAEAFLSHREQVEEHWYWLREQVQRLDIANLPRQLVHGDVSPVNMVFSGSSAQFGLIDWDCLHRGLRLYDVLGDILNRPPAAQAEAAPFRREEVLQCLQGYREACDVPLSSEELAAVLPLCLARQLEDLRQRMHVLPLLPTPKDAEYATLIRGRVHMMEQIRAEAGRANDWSQSLWT